MSSLESRLETFISFLLHIQIYVCVQRAGLDRAGPGIKPVFNSDQQKAYDFLLNKHVLIQFDLNVSKRIYSYLLNICG